MVDTAARKTSIHVAPLPLASIGSNGDTPEGEGLKALNPYIIDVSVRDLYEP